MAHFSTLDSIGEPWGTPEFVPQVVAGCPLIDVGLVGIVIDQFLPATPSERPEITMAVER